MQKTNELLFEPISHNEAILLLNQQYIMISELHTQLKNQQEINQHLQDELEKFHQLILNQNRALYGSKSEKNDLDDATQLGLFNQDDRSQTNSSDESLEDEVTVITYTRSGVKKKTKDFSGLPRQIVEHLVPEDQRTCSCGLHKMTIRYEHSEQLHYQRAQLSVIEHRREVMACPNECGQSMTSASVASHILPKTKATPELLAHVVVSKIEDRQPSYHLSNKLKTRFDIEIPRNTMARWIIKLSKKLIPLVNLMKETLRSYDIAWMDATTLQVLNEPNRKPTTKSYAWCFKGGPPDKQVIIFDYNALDHKQYLEDFLEGFKGFIHSDADKRYDDLEKKGDIHLSYCNVHARRYFEAIAKNSKKPAIAKKVMAIYSQIYAIEKAAKKDKLLGDALVLNRKSKIQPLMNQIKLILDENSYLESLKLPLSQAINYTKNHWVGLNRFIEDGRLEPDNNQCEREIRPFVIARKNFLFADSVDGADALGIHFTLIRTAKLHGLDPYHYYVHILKQIPLCNTFKDYEDLLPWNVHLHPIRS